MGIFKNKQTKWNQDDFTIQQCSQNKGADQLRITHISIVFVLFAGVQVKRVDVVIIGSASMGFIEKYNVFDTQNLEYPQFFANPCIL